MMRSALILAGGAIAIAAGLAATVGSPWLQPAPPAIAASIPPTTTAEVTRGALVDTETVTGTLAYGEISTLRPRLAEASATITWIAPVGSTVERGQLLYALDGQPSILFYGSAPQYRTLRFDPGGDAPVWVELEQARDAAEAAGLTLDLEAARLADAEVRIADATARLEDALSPAPVTAEFIRLAGAVSAAQAKLARVSELSAAELTPAIDIAAAEAELAAARAMLDEAIRVLRKDHSDARLDIATARIAVATAETKRDELQTALDILAAQETGDADIRLIAENLAALGYEGALSDQVRAWQRDSGLPVTGIVGPSHLVVAPGPVHIAAHSASVGETLVASSQDGGVLLEFSVTEKLVSVPLSVADRGLAAIGRAVTITLPDNRDIEGIISEIGSVVADGAVEVTINVADQTALGGLEIASVDVEFASSSREDVLSVPIAALLAMPEGGYAVEVVTGAASTLVPVETGLFAAGRVEIRGEAIVEGMQVGVPG